LYWPRAASNLGLQICGVTRGKLLRHVDYPSALFSAKTALRDKNGFFDICLSEMLQNRLDASRLLSLVLRNEANQRCLFAPKGCRNISASAVNVSEVSPPDRRRFRQ